MPPVIRTDEEAWAAYPALRHWFDKLLLADRLGHVCGPGGVDVPVAGEYVVRPVMNLRGMGAGARIAWLAPGGGSAEVAPGFFWCERFLGEHVSLELQWDGDGWALTSAWQGTNEPERLSHFTAWRRYACELELPPWLDELQPCGCINVEAIGGRIIEVHLRSTPDPLDFDLLVPAWSESHRAELDELYGETHTWVPAEISDDPHLPRRLGFYCR